MFRTSVPVVAFVVVFASLAGCIGGDDEGVAKASTRAPLKSSADVSGNLGGIQGLVTDAAIVPIEGATVSVPDLGLSTVVADDGSYAFSLLKPGLYTLVAAAEGFEAQVKDVKVKAEAVVAADFLLEQVASQVPYADIIEFNGFIECSVSTPVVRVAVCAIPNSVIGENTTNDKFLFTFKSAPDPQSYVAQLDWQTSQPTGTTMSFILEPEGIFNDRGTEFGRAIGKSPLLIRTERPRIIEADANMTATCKGERPPGSSLAPPAEDYCSGGNYAKSGGGVWTRVFVAGRIVDAAPDQEFVGAAVQQPLHQLIGMFYHAPAPVDFTFAK